MGVQHQTSAGVRLRLLQRGVNIPSILPPHIVKEIQVVCDMPADAFNRLYAHFCRYPSFRDVLLRSDPVMYERLARITLPAKPTRKKKK